MQNNDTFPQTTESEEIQSLIAQSKTRVLESFERGSLNTKVEDPSNIFLSKYIGTTLRLVVLYVDLVGSTLMTRSLPVNRLATIIQAFTQEMSFLVPKFGGQVLKYVGDAVVAYFPFSGSNYSLAYNTAVDCSNAMIMVIQGAINPVISMHGYDELQIKIGLDTSEHSVVQYIIDEKPYADILGYGISMAAKLSTLANSNEVIISHTIYMGMHSSLRKKFSEVELDPRMWKYIDEHFQPGVWKSYPLQLSSLGK